MVRVIDEKLTKNQKIKIKKKHIKIIKSRKKNQEKKLINLILKSGKLILKFSNFFFLFLKHLSKLHLSIDLKEKKILFNNKIC